MDELMEKVNYVGQEKALRRLLLTNGYSTTDLATMTLSEVCEEVLKHYSVVGGSGDEILLVRNEDEEQLKKLIEVIRR